MTSHQNLCHQQLLRQNNGPTLEELLQALDLEAVQANPPKRKRISDMTPQDKEDLKKRQQQRMESLREERKKKRSKVMYLGQPGVHKVETSNAHRIKNVLGKNAKVQDTYVYHKQLEDAKNRERQRQEEREAKRVRSMLSSDEKKREVKRVRSMLSRK